MVTFFSDLNKPNCHKFTWTSSKLEISYVASFRWWYDGYIENLFLRKRDSWHERVGFVEHWGEVIIWTTFYFVLGYFLLKIRKIIFLKGSKQPRLSCSRTSIKSGSSKSHDPQKSFPPINRVTNFQSLMTSIRSSAIHLSTINWAWYGMSLIKKNYILIHLYGVRGSIMPPSIPFPAILLSLTST